jgi:hypothetical protein
MDEQARLAWVRKGTAEANIDDFIARKTERTPWFAWRPVTIRGKAGVVAKDLSTQSRCLC